MRPGSTGGQQPRDPVRQHPGLAGSGPGHDQQRSAGVLHGLSLRLIQTLNQGRSFWGRSGASAGFTRHRKFGVLQSRTGTGRESRQKSGQRSVKVLSHDPTSVVARNVELRDVSELSTV